MEKELPELKVSMLGRFSMTHGEQTVSFKRNTATKAVKLLQILLHESFCGSGEQAGIPRTELLEDLFGREELSNVANNLRVTVHRLKKMLVEAGLPEYDYIKIENGIYRGQPDEGPYRCGGLFGSAAEGGEGNRGTEEDGLPFPCLPSLSRGISSGIVGGGLGDRQQRTV